MSRAVLVLFCLGVLGCASDGGARRSTPPPGAAVPASSAAALQSPPPTEAERGNPAAEAAEHGLPIATVGGRALFAGDLLEQWLHRDSQALWEQMHLLVAGELARLEAERLGVRVSAELVSRRTAAHLGALRESMARRYPGERLEVVLRERMQLDPERFAARMERDTLRELVTERVVRFHSATVDRVRLRVVRLSDQESARSIAQRARAGEDFAALAREHSRDPSAADGGMLPPLSYSPDSPLARLAFAAPVGVPDGPFQVGDMHLVLLVEERLPARRGSYEERAAEVEASLLEQPVVEAEFLAWQVDAERRWEVDLAPFLKLVGEPAPPRSPRRP